MMGLTIVIGTGLLALSLVAWAIQALIKKLKRSKRMDKMLGCYYLHVNGELIFKSEAVFMNTTKAEYFDSDFVVKWWTLSATSPTGAFETDVKWSMDWMREAFVLSSNKGKTAESLAKICETNKWPPMILDAIVNNKKVEVLRSTSLDTDDPKQISPCVAIQVIEGEPYA